MVVFFFFQIEVIVLRHEYFIPALVITPVLIGHPIDILLFLRRRTLVAVLATKKKSKCPNKTLQSLLSNNEQQNQPLNEQQSRNHCQTTMPPNVPVPYGVLLSY